MHIYTTLGIQADLTYRPAKELISISRIFPVDGPKENRVVTLD
jgi:hypothetical protein